MANTLRLASDDRDLDHVLQSLQRLGEVPRMGIPVGARRQVFRPYFCEVTGISAEVGDVHDDQPLDRNFPVFHQGKEEVRGAKPRIDHLDIVGQLQFLKFLHYSRSKSVVCEERVTTPCNHDLAE